MNTNTPNCKNLVLDAGPLLSLSPLRGLAENYITVPQVLAELKDKRARDHFEQLGLSTGVKVDVRSPDAASIAHVIQWAKKTGDYAVLSHADICVLALTYALHEQEKAVAAKAAVPSDDANNETRSPEVEEHKDERDEQDAEPLDVQLERVTDDENAPQAEPSTSTSSSNSVLHSPPSLSPDFIYDDPSDEDDGEGEWITPTNVGLHKSRALNFLPSQGGKKAPRNKAPEKIGAGCMTADFAVQNVLLQMNLSLVGLEGRRIERVKSWVLRCHACFKICKDNSKKFCPSCGNPTLMRTSVTISAPDATEDAPAMQIHLKPNFQYRLRGTKYSIPAPKPGSAKTGTREGLILREDQIEYVRAKKRAEGKRQREEARMLKDIMGRGDKAGAAGVGSWMDPDWIPEIMTVGSGGKGRSIHHSGMDGDMPVVGYGRKNPNERRRKGK
ncbi:hypothetical protein FISHEDRAFT_41556 [Fistulina hepatica ATCC 64428]|nr:hypothetical protein FISHEDRAFT_41556 [Fistulina hepatica ATCC 64428]